jgi:hypothetical protein
VGTEARMCNVDKIKGYFKCGGIPYRFRNDAGMKKYSKRWNG